MKQQVPVGPFEPDRYLGTVTQIEAAKITINLPFAAQPPRLHLGARVGLGEVGEFVVVEVGPYAIFGRIARVRLPERERLRVEPTLAPRNDANPTGEAQLLSTISPSSGEHTVGIARLPRIGDRVYSAHPRLVQWIVEREELDMGISGGEAKSIALGALASDAATLVALTPERLFGRHCAVVGATGSGKSWTVAKLIEELAEHPSKVILIDATGEFHTIGGATQHVSLGTSTDRPDGAIAVAMPHHALEEADLFALFKPSPGIQAPRLREAIRSLRLAHVLDPDDKLVAQGLIVKAEQPREPYDAAIRANAALVHAPDAEFNITLLPEQLRHECVWPTSKFGPTFGGVNQNDLGMCAGLMSRIENYLASPEFEPILRPEHYASLVAEIATFLKDRDLRTLRISLRHLPFKQDAREIVANAIGRHLLQLAREGVFAKQPTLLALDEAHQFLNRTIGDEAMRISLDAFELVAKEGRKYSLTCLLATQRPRDLPDGVISQIGTLVVHRLTNDRDREIIERASSDIDRAASSMLPTLVPGEAVLVGVDFPIPVTVRVAPPARKPDSRGPDYQAAWSA